MSNTAFLNYVGRTLFSISGVNSRYQLTSVTFQNNSATSAANRAPVEVLNGGQFGCRGCRFTNNIYNDANAVYALDANRLDITACTFFGNNRQNGPGGEEPNYLTCYLTHHSLMATYSLRKLVRFF
jgi:hypothetical protein